MKQTSCLAFAVALFVGCWGVSQASLITYEFTSNVTSGPLAGASFTGDFSYESSNGTGVGQEFLTLASLDFTLNGVQFTKADLSQGGQVITQDGRALFFTAAFFPPPPDNSPVNDIAFGFGGPGIIGYNGPTGAPGSGTYTLTLIPESEIWVIVLLGCSLALALRRQRTLQML